MGESLVKTLKTMLILLILSGCAVYLFQVISNVWASHIADNPASLAQYKKVEVLISKYPGQTPAVIRDEFKHNSLTQGHAKQYIKQIQSYLYSIKPASQASYKQVESLMNGNKVAGSDIKTYVSNKTLTQKQADDFIKKHEPFWGSGIFQVLLSVLMTFVTIFGLNYFLG